MARSRLSYAGRPALSVALTCSLACAAVMLCPREAYAGRFDLGIDGDATAIVAPASTATKLNDAGTGFKLRFGDQFRLRHGIRLTPEVGYAFDYLFPAGSDAGSQPWNMNRFFAGARLGFGRIVVPTIYAHVGVGFRSVGGPTNQLFPNSTGVEFDTGVAVDFYLSRHFAIGPHVEFVDLDTTPNNPEWLAFGAHIDIVF
jgi:hypothetical protein